MAYIYIITNKVNGKQYIGQTKQHDYNKRWYKHKSLTSGSVLLLKAFEKYGLQNFSFKILIVCFDEDRWKFEKEYIHKYKTLTPNGYNFLDGTMSGYEHTDDSKKKISQGLKNYYSQREKEGNQKIIIEKHRNVMANAVGKRVIQYDENKNKIAEFVCLREAERQTGIARSSISLAIKQGHLQKHGFYWKLDE
jgi:group I intron endonuclease